MYDKFPSIAISSDESLCKLGWSEIGAALRARVNMRNAVICVECYPGTILPPILEGLSAGLSPDHLVRAEECYLTSGEIEFRFEAILTTDPVFGRVNAATLDDFLDPAKAELARASFAIPGLHLVLGTGASLLAPHPDILVYADLARWEIQRRYRGGLIGNLGLDKRGERASLKYKRSYFLDWRIADRLKTQLLPKIDFLLDCNQIEEPKMISGSDFHRALEVASHRPFRVVPFFDPGPWGGHWMEAVCDLPRDKPNYAWCFDCVPEENSLLLGFGARQVEIPALDLVLMQPRALLGDFIERTFGAEFPIRFDFLDTIGGGNLSLQVHPLTAYIREHFGMHYTQDESYYLLDAGADACVYLGLRESIDPAAMTRELRAASTSTHPQFNAENHVNKFPARKHDHFLIPAGTVHCSGRNSMVLEISATPYIFTFKLWDWARMDLEGNPRPLHLDHGFANICWDRRTHWVEENLINRFESLGSAPGWREERTGLHALEFIETRRHWFNGPVPHHTHGTVNVLNLVEGDAAVVESPVGAFTPFEIHYAETFIVPASVGPYTIRPRASLPAADLATIMAFVRQAARIDK